MEQLGGWATRDNADQGFAPFDDLVGLDYPALYYPASDTDAVYSSVVIYTYNRNIDHNFTVWEGPQTQDVLGVRYYTEHYVDSGNRYKGTVKAWASMSTNI